MQNQSWADIVARLEARTAEQLAHDAREQLILKTVMRWDELNPKPPLGAFIAAVQVLHGKDVATEVLSTLRFGYTFFEHAEEKDDTTIY